jgi:hypothetical protein
MELKIRESLIFLSKIFLHELGAFFSRSRVYGVKDPAFPQPCHFFGLGLAPRKRGAYYRHGRSLINLGLR